MLNSVVYQYIWGKCADHSALLGGSVRLGECQQASRGALSDVTVLIEGVVGGGDESAAWVRLRHAHVGDFQLDVEPVARTGRGGLGKVY